MLPLIMYKFGVKFTWGNINAQKPPLVTERWSFLAGREKGYEGWMIIREIFLRLLYSLLPW